MKTINKLLYTALFYKNAIQRAIAAVVVLSMSAQVHAATFSLSKIFDGIKTEGAAIAPILLILFALVGVVITGSSLISAWSNKKNNQPLSWQLWGVIVGALTTVIPVVIMAFAGTLTGGVSSGDDAVNQLNLTY